MKTSNNSASGLETRLDQLILVIDLPAKKKLAAELEKKSFDINGLLRKGGRTRW